MKIEKVAKIKYINNDMSLGIDYDRRKISKVLHDTIIEVCHKIGVDTNAIYMESTPADIIWSVLCSERNVGKTTYEILEGLTMFLMYGTRIEYIRTRKDNVAPSNAISIFDTILQCDYISNMTGGEYNDVRYKDKFWYLAHRNENGEIDKVDNNPFMRMHNLQDGVENTKSTYNSPKGDKIIYDEFIPVNGITKENDWLALCQLIETIRRSRLSIRICLLANTINSLTHYFHELGIFDVIQKMSAGEKKIVKNLHGTDVYIYIIKFDEEITEKRKVNNLKVFGFLYKNPRMASITGSGTWEVKNYPHLPKLPKDDYTVVSPRIFYEHYGRLMRLEIRESKTIGIYAYVWETFTDPYYRGDELIYTLGLPDNPQKVYACGMGKPIDKLILNLYKQNRMYYSYNDIGNLFENYMLESGKMYNKRGL